MYCFSFRITVYLSCFLQTQLPTQENIQKPNSELSAPPYTLSPLIGSSELNKMGITLPQLLAAGFNQNIKTSNSNYAEIVNNCQSTVNNVSNISDEMLSSSKIFVQNNQILNIQEPIRLGKYGCKN